MIGQFDEDNDQNFITLILGYFGLAITLSCQPKHAG